MPTKDHERAQEHKNMESLRLFQNEEVQNRETVMDDFLFFLDYDCEQEINKEDRNDLQNLISLFLGYDIDRVKQAELTLLERWNKSVLG